MLTVQVITDDFEEDDSDFEDDPRVALPRPQQKQFQDDFVYVEAKPRKARGKSLVKVGAEADPNQKVRVHMKKR